MKIGKKFNALSLAEYRYCIARHRQYTDFNPLGLFRSILENPKLDEAAKQQVLALAKAHFGPFYDFLVVKDIHTYAKLSRLGQPPLPPAQEWQHLEKLRQQAEKILAAKKIRHWRVGIYSVSERFARDAGSPAGYRIARVMTQRKSQKWVDTARVPHLRQRKDQARLIRQALQEEQD